MTNEWEIKGNGIEQKVIKIPFFFLFGVKALLKTVKLESEQQHKVVLRRHHK